VPEHGGTGFLEEAAAAAVLDTLVAGEAGEQQASYGAVHLLPSDMFGKKTVVALEGYHKPKKWRASFKCRQLLAA
jgi:hypothetical protein